MRIFLSILLAGISFALIQTARADTINFGALGPNFSLLPSPVSGVTVGGVGYDAFSPNGQQFMRLDEGNGWAGEFAHGLPLLFDRVSGAVTLIFTSGLSSIDLAAQANFYGAYTSSLAAYSGATLLGTVNASGFNDLTSEGTVPYLFFGGTNITSIVITTTNDGAGFAMGGVPVTGVPEPSTWMMMLIGFGMVGLVVSSRRAWAA